MRWLLNFAQLILNLVLLKVKTKKLKILRRMIVGKLCSSMSQIQINNIQQIVRTSLWVTDQKFSMGSSNKMRRRILNTDTVLQNWIFRVVKRVVKWGKRGWHSFKKVRCHFLIGKKTLKHPMTKCNPKNWLKLICMKVL